MSELECGVCGYIHKEENPPEKCPICEAPDKMFKEKKDEVEEAPAPQMVEDLDSNGWECGVCGYMHKEDQAPEKCPTCEAPDKMFTEKKGAVKEAETEETVTEQTQVQDQEHVEAVVEEKADLPEKQWRCAISGYLHTGPEPPEKCPVCEATAEQFEEVVEPEKEDVVEEPAVVASETRWRCTVCGYIHEGDAPPDKCPLCGADASLFVEVDADGKTIGGEEEENIPAQSGESPATVADEAQAPVTFFDRIASLILKFHLHPIHTHFPNGILPVVVVFLGLGIFLNIASLEVAAFYNSIAVLVILPVVIFTGYVEWQKRYKGLKSAIFITKIICSMIVLASVNVLVFWRVIDPGVAAEGSPTQMIYLGVAGLSLAAAGIAGHLGGKLTFAGRN